MIQSPSAVSFAGSVSVLVTIQLMTALAIANLVSRKDAAPSILVAPLDGMVGKVLCLSDMPLIGQVSFLQHGYGALRDTTGICNCSTLIPVFPECFEHAVTLNIPEF